MIERIKIAVASSLLAILYRLLSFTWRKTSEPYPQKILDAIRDGKPYVGAHFHEDEWSLAAFYLDVHPNVLVSHSRDGTLMTHFLTKLGFHVARGSSSRGAVAGFLALLRMVKESTDPEKLVTLAVDGPRGPRRRAKNGVFKLADVLDGEILTASVAADRSWVFKRSWSNAFLPKPFARVHRAFVMGPDLAEVRKLIERGDLAELAYGLERSIIDAKSLAQKSLSFDSLSS